jgi:hypothetical protein
MPGRWLSVAIVAFWVGMNGWLFFSDLWPRWQAGQPPAYEIDLLQEVQTKRPWVPWAVFQDGRKVFQAQTRVEHPERDVYEMKARFLPVPGSAPATVSFMQVRRMSSTYRVSNDDLLAVDVEFEGTVPAARLLKGARTEFLARIHGEVRGGRFAPVLELPALRDKPLRLPEVEVKRHGAVMLPLHPVDRIRGLTPGRRWQVPVFDPVAESLHALVPADQGPRVLHARVLPDPVVFAGGRRGGEPCLVIEYTGDDTKLETWVSRRDGVVLCQQATLAGSLWTMNRE